MSKQLFDVDLGFSLEDDSGNISQILNGSGVPGSTTATNGAPKGSGYLDVATGKFHTKETAGSGTDKWEIIASQAYVLSQVASDVSWRLPVKAVLTDTYADIAAVKTDADADDILETVAVLSGDRFLVTDLTSGNENVYIVSGSSGNWTFTEDTNLATDGDTLIADEGLEAGRQWLFDGTTWFYVNQSNLDEQGFIRGFIGKTGAGSESPTYSSTNYATGDLETAIGAIDAQVGTNVTNIGTNTTNIGTNTTNIGTNTGNISDNADAILFGRTSTNLSNVSGSTTISVDLVDEVAAVIWSVYAQGETEGTAHLKYAGQIFATHDGHNTGAGDDATTVDFTVTTKLKLGNLSGIDFDVVLSGAGGTQAIELNVASSTNANVTVIREVIEMPV